MNEKIENLTSKINFYNYTFVNKILSPRENNSSLNRKSAFFNFIKFFQKHRLKNMKSFKIMNINSKLIDFIIFIQIKRDQLKIRIQFNTLS